jgi:Fur family zinc uptake transcriptional regulator
LNPVIDIQSLNFSYGSVRLTEQRKTVLQLLCVSNKPLSAYELLERMRGVVKNPAPPTVYRALDFLLE